MNLYPKPQDEIVAEMAVMFDQEQLETFEELSAIRQFDGHFPCGHAECLAMLQVLRRYPEILTRITALQIELDGGTEWLLTNDLSIARQHLANVGGKEVVIANLTTVISEQYGGLATLTTLG